jgi:CheY-like chemotaxis protein
MEGPDGEKRWYRFGKAHREDGPAIIRGDGSKEWFRDGKHHREDGPAIEGADGSRRWYFNGEPWDDGPSVVARQTAVACADRIATSCTPVQLQADFPGGTSVGGGTGVVSGSPMHRAAKSPILIVEDDPDTAGAFQTLLEAEGYSVEALLDATEALQRLHMPPRPSLIILDYVLGKATGDDFRRAQRGAPAEIAAEPVILCSGIYDVRGIAERLGAAAFFTKPVEPMRMLEIVRRHYR